MNRRFNGEAWRGKARRLEYVFRYLSVVLSKNGESSVELDGTDCLTGGFVASYI